MGVEVKNGEGSQAVQSVIYSLWFGCFVCYSIWRIDLLHLKLDLQCVLRVLWLVRLRFNDSPNVTLVILAVIRNNSSITQSLSISPSKYCRVYHHVLPLLQQ